MKFLFLTWALLFSVTTVTAGQKLVGLDSSDLSILESGAGCWLEDSKKNLFIYDNMKHAAVKIDKKVIKLNRKSGHWDSGFYNCGETYEYTSEDKAMNVTVQMGKAKKDRCLGKILVNESSTIVKRAKLESNCGS